MRRKQQLWVGCLVAALGVMLLIGRLSAQAPGQGAGSSPSSLEQRADEFGQQLLAGPDGQVYRLWLRNSGDLARGGGGVLLAAASPGDTWKTLLELFPPEPGVSAMDPNVAFGSSKEIALVYQRWTNNPRSKQIRIARSGDGGATWIRSDTPIEASGKGFSPKVAWGRGGSLVVTWADERRSEKAWDVWTRRSPDGGITWEPEQKLSRFAKERPADLAVQPVIVGDGQNRYWIVWLGLLNEQSRFYLSRSLDDGRTWTEPVALTGQSQSVFSQRLLRSGEHLLVVWQDARTGRDRLYSVVSDDAGATWTEPTRIDHVPDDATFSAGVSSVVLAADGEAYTAWADGRNGRDDVFIARSTDWGRTWGAEDTRLDMDEPGTAMSRFPKVARASDGRLAVVWEDDRDGSEGVYLRIRGPGPSAAWGPEIVVATPPGRKRGARLPSALWGRDGVLYVTWDFWNDAATPKQIGARNFTPDKK
ncbi:MAG TPA: sialidase family protein [Candidatus Methylomirabilis sp.]|nr:sialidase family protein [Candidatus Methylomirabilis sp.]